MPLPERHEIITLLQRERKPLALAAIADALGARDDEERDILARRLRAMERDGQVLLNRRDEYGLVERMDLVRGRVVGHRDGYGFLIPDEGGDDLFLSPRQMRSLMHGDRAVAHVVGRDHRGRPEGALVSVLERNTREVVGRFVRESGVSFVVPDEPRHRHDVLVANEDAGDARDGDMVVVEIVEYPGKRRRPLGRVREVLGAHMAPGMEVDIAIRSHNLPAQFPPEALAQAEALGERVAAPAKRGREDLRELPLVTIDGADARDFDDAVHARATARGWKLTVAIADVATYVKPGDALDQEAEWRGNSVYFPERVLPMLPEALSNGLCSLRPEEDRLCMVCEMLVDRSGSVTRARFAEGLMRSHARLTYSEVAAIVVERDSAARSRRESLLPHLDELYRLFKALRRAREKRGALDLDTRETRIALDASGKVSRVEPIVRNDAHRLIEECMVAANVAAARFVQRHKKKVLFRVHDGAKPDGLDALRTFLAALGLTLAGGAKPTPRHYRALLARTRRRPDAVVIQTLVLRSLAQAVYSPDNIGHFGLALDAYAHFTSPIRRYADLLLHRAIKHVLRRGRRAPYDYDRERLIALGEHVSMTERRADDATRDAIDWLKCEFMLDKVGREYAGTVTGVTAFGLFVMLDELHVEGLVHISAVGNDYFHFDAGRQQLAGESSGDTFGVGDPIRVRVLRVDLDERKIDFERVGPRRSNRRARGDGRRRARTRRRRG